MASFVFTGTATGHINMLAKIKEHLTDGATLGAQVWTAIGTNPVYFKGPGLAGSDNIYLQILSYSNVNIDQFGLQCYAAVNYNPINSFYAQPGQSPPAYVPLWDSEIPYWLIVNGRRFILIAKVSTTYQTYYGGFILPYATPAEMPYPIVNMGSVGSQDSTVRWSAGNYRVSGFWDPVENSSFLRHWNGTWLQIQNVENRSDGIRIELSDHNVWPYEKDYGFGLNQDGSYGLLPCIIHSNYGSGNVIGELDGVYFCTGFSNAAEDIITVGADNYLVVQSIYRTSRRDYVAIKLG